MMRISEPGDIGRLLRYAGRLGHQASLGAARLRDLADVVRSLAISLVLDSHGGWVSVRELGGACGPGLEVLAFDRPTGDPADDAPWREPGSWPHLHSQLDDLGELGGAVRVAPTPGGGTAVWTRIHDRADVPPPAVAGPAVSLDVTGLLQAPAGEMYAGWSAARHRDRLRILMCEAPPDASAATLALLRTALGPEPKELWAAHRHLLAEFARPLGEGAATLVEVDLAERTARTLASRGIATRLVADGTPVGAGEATGEGAVHWERSLSLLAHTAGIRCPEDYLPTAPAALSCATLMREHREPTPAACVVAAHFEVN
ncbi:hypothetical protein GCM10028772_43880 [Nocardioides ultimimeridianus]